MGSNPSIAFYVILLLDWVVNTKLKVQMSIRYILKFEDLLVTNTNVKVNRLYNVILCISKPNMIEVNQDKMYYILCLG